MASGLGDKVIPANPDAGGEICLVGSGDASVVTDIGDMGDKRVAAPDPGT